MVYRDKETWGFVHFATREGAIRLLGEGAVYFHRRRLEVKPSESKHALDDAERGDLVKRAIARHFHKKAFNAGPPPAFPGSYPPPPAGYYGGPPPPAGYYG